MPSMVAAGNIKQETQVRLNRTDRAMRWGCHRRLWVHNQPPNCSCRSCGRRRGLRRRRGRFRKSPQSRCRWRTASLKCAKVLKCTEVKFCQRKMVIKRRKCKTKACISYLIRISPCKSALHMRNVWCLINKQFSVTWVLWNAYRNK